MEKLKVLLADSSIFYRKFVAEAVEKTGMGRVERIASNGSIAVEWIGQSDFDVVLLDVLILKNEGMGVLRAVRQEKQDVEIIIMGTQGDEHAETILEALKLGAIDFILRPVGLEGRSYVEAMRSYLYMLFAQVKIKGYSNPTGGTKGVKPVQQLGIQSKEGLQFDNVSKPPRSSLKRPDLVVIASSTGGPYALEAVLGGLTAEIKTPILVVQHMPAGFTPVLAQSLDRKSRLKVREAIDFDTPAEGHVMIAPGGMHMTLVPQGNTGKTIRLMDTPLVNGVRPSADVLLNSAADVCGGAGVLLVVLTGMGNDGTKGLERLKQKCSCYCITQSERTCVVYGMPRSVYEAGLSDEVVDIENISERINAICLNRR